MSQLPDPESHLSEVLRLATLLSDQVLDAQIMKRPVPEDQIRSLLEAGLLLEEYEYPLPPMLGQIMQNEIDAAAGQAVPSETELQDEQSKVKGIAWVMRSFQRRR